MTTDAALDWSAVEKIDAWLDREVAETYKGQPLGQDWARVAKAGEELAEAIEAMNDGQPSAQDWARVAEIGAAIGRAIDALIGATGQNPRKDFYSDPMALYGELADVACTAILRDPALHQGHRRDPPSHPGAAGPDPRASP